MTNELKTPDVVVSVGTDHHRFDRMIQWIDSWAARNPGIDILVQRGTAAPATNCTSVETVPFADLCEMFARATAVVTHGGPSTVMDARAAGRLPIVLARNPEFEEHVDGHQMRFARHMAQHKVARVVETEDDLHAALDMAMADPGEFVVPVDTEASSGVVQFAQAVDSLIGTTTPLIPSSPAGAGMPSGSALAAADDQ